MAEKMGDTKLRLYHYWRSSSSWRVRWALAFKGIDCEFVPVDLLTDDAESVEHRLRNPLGYVPVLEMLKLPGDDSTRFLSQSTAIIEWLEETHPSPSLLPGDAYQRAWIRQLAQVIAADTQPLQNLGPQFMHSDDAGERKEWAQHWIINGLTAYEALAARTSGRFSVGDTLTLADLCLVPQCYNARRNDVDLSQFPTIVGIEAEALKSEACKRSHPDCFKPEA